MSDGKNIGGLVMNNSIIEFLNLKEEEIYHQPTKLFDP
jgi:hypothetical protein